MATLPSRGEIWLANLDPTRGHEQAGTRPVLIVSTNSFNHGPADLAFVLPLTTKNRRNALHISVAVPEGAVIATSYIMCDSLRCIARERLGPRAWGRISNQTMEQVEDRLRILLEL
jgi:mRNA interferase MazF